jgi:hypothetical protein
VSTTQKPNIERSGVVRTEIRLFFAKFLTFFQERNYSEAGRVKF